MKIYVVYSLQDGDVEIHKAYNKENDAINEKESLNMWFHRRGVDYRAYISEAELK